MIKDIKIDSKNKITVNSGAGWYLIYRSQFGHDILPDLMPMIEALITGAAAIVGKDENLSLQSVVQAINDGDMSDAMITLSGLEMVTVLDITWAMAKNADRDIPEPETWINQFETFPLDVIVPQVMEMAIKGSISTKNFKRLQDLKKSLKEIKDQ